MVRSVFCLVLLASAVCAQDGGSVLLVVNGNSAISRQVAAYYRVRRGVPIKNVCTVAAPEAEEIHWDVYEKQIETPVGECLKRSGLTEKVLYIVLTMGLPLKVDGPGTGMMAEHCSVDSELALLYAKLKNVKFQRAGGVANPFFGKRDAPFRHPQFAIYLVTRLAAYDLKDVKAMIDRSLAARNRGKFVLDAGPGNGQGNDWLSRAALLLPGDRVVLDQTPNVIYGQKDVIGYASWGSNDGGRTHRWLGFQWLPGAVATEYVSTNARTLKFPPENWVFGGAWDNKERMFGGSAQSLSADLLHEGATGASGNVYEPYLTACVRPDYLLPAYQDGRNLAESYYLGLPLLSWQGIIFGDPLCSLR